MTRKGEVARKATSTSGCFCGASTRYENCCGVHHRDALSHPAPTAEALMRSRYSAFVLGLTEFLLDTWHPQSRPGHLQPLPMGFQWLGLEVRRHTQIDADHAEVEFVARSKLNGRAQRLHEVSRFERVNGLWMYVDGAIPQAGNLREG